MIQKITQLLLILCILAAILVACIEVGSSDAGSEAAATPISPGCPTLR